MTKHCTNLTNRFGFTNPHSRPDPPQLLSVTTNTGPWHLRIEHTATETFSPAPRQTNIQEHEHAVYHMVLCTEGRTHFSLLGQRIHATPGTLILTSPGQPHQFGRHGQSPVTYRQLTFALIDQHGQTASISFAEYLRLWSGRNFRLPAMPCQLDSATRRQWVSLFDRMHESLARSETEDRLDCHMLIAEMFRLIIQLADPPIHNTGISEDLLAVRRWLDHHYAQPASVDDLAQMAFLSTGQFSRNFKKAFGLSPMAYRRQLRLHAAANLLRSTNLSCEQIARQLGFVNTAHLSRAFSQANGCSPSAYRHGRTEFEK